MFYEVRGYGDDVVIKKRFYDLDDAKMFHQILIDMNCPVVMLMRDTGSGYRKIHERRTNGGDGFTLLD